jgi:hypothetical protein
MKNHKVQFLSLSLLLLSLAQNLNGQVKPIALHPANPHYFLYDGKPTILITSGEHYGAVMNPDFDCKTYLKTLQKDGLNLTRTMTGGYFEPSGAFNITKNTLAPDQQKYLCPWQRVGDGSKFDLTKWDEAYFTRLRDFVAEAKKRGVIVELSLFCPFYEEMQWKLSPFNILNNVNSLGAIPRTDVYTLDKNKGLLEVQEAMVRKLVIELKDCPNVIYEICNEPYFGGITLEWQGRIAQVITETESSFVQHHLISQNIANGSQKITDPDPLVSVFNFHYAAPPTAVTQNYGLNKVIGENETGFKGQKDSTYRKEAWELILTGGGLFNNLDYSFTTDNEDGTFQYPAAQPGGGSVAYRQQMGCLKKFIESFDFVNMKPDTTVYSGGLSGKNKVTVLAEPGKQYAIYWMGGKQVNLELNLPAGHYSLEWMNPLTGKKEKKISLNHPGGKAKIESPGYQEDFALKIAWV